ncbi:MAG: BON domain-containing protein [Gammaproteobacteria bacterium]
MRGPVDSEAEKTRIATLAREAAGVKNLNNQLEIDRD